MNRSAERQDDQIPTGYEEAKRAVLGIFIIGVMTIVFCYMAMVVIP